MNINLLAIPLLSVYPTERKASAHTTLVQDTCSCISHHGQGEDRAQVSIPWWAGKHVGAPWCRILFSKEKEQRLDTCCNRGGPPNCRAGASEPLAHGRIPYLWTVQRSKPMETEVQERLAKTGDANVG